MALYVKQDFTPPIFSRKWIAMQFRPNMLLYCHKNIVLILESGLLFREDSVEVEQESPGAAEVWGAAGGAGGGWLTRGERLLSLVAMAGSLVFARPKALNHSLMYYLSFYASVPVAIRTCHRHFCRGALPALLARMRDYLTLARRAAACLRECAALRAELGSFSSIIESTHTMLCRQQSELAVSISRASAAILGNAPWLRSDVAWGAVPSTQQPNNLMQIHHAYLVVQSTLLKHIAMAHYIPSVQAQKMYKNHNERLYWIHNTLIVNLTDEIQQNFEALQRMYRLLKNYGTAETNDNKKFGNAMKDSWLYTEIHSDIVRANLELKLALNKSSNLDLFLDSCALSKQEINLNALNKDIDGLIGNITKSLSTVQSSQIRLKKLLNKFSDEQIDNEENSCEFVENEKEIVRIDDKEPETKDEVFYFVKTEDDYNTVAGSSDILTQPGKEVKETTKIVLNELKRKLLKREDMMRERERQALKKTMPELKNNVPEFPRQINVNEITEKRSYFSKLSKDMRKKKLFNKYTIQPRRKMQKAKSKYISQMNNLQNELALKTPSIYKVNSNLNIRIKGSMLHVNTDDNYTQISNWLNKSMQKPVSNNRLDDVLSGYKNIDGSTADRSVKSENLNNNNQEENGKSMTYRFTKKDLELLSSTDNSEDEMHKREEMLKDIRRYRANRRKTHPDKRGAAYTDKLEDEGLRPNEYSFGAGLAMASVLQINSKARAVNMAAEDVFMADGEMDEDSGNDDD